MRRVRMYTKQGCLFSERARLFLEEKGIPYDEIDITDDPEARAEMVEASAGQDTTPQLFVDGEHLGGLDDLEDEDRQGRLAGLILLPTEQGAPATD